MSDPPRYVVDASVAVKWHLRDESHEDEARLVLIDYRGGASQLMAPDHIRYEVPSAILGAVRRGRLPADVGATAIRQFLSWGIQTVASGELIQIGYSFSVRFRCSLYDGLYLALAELTGSRFIFADQRLRNNLADSFPLAVWIGDYPVFRSSIG
ncbi:MAG: type II toxin-antitoxin system VapC family toxin [Chloroflexota bacterium]